MAYWAEVQEWRVKEEENVTIFSWGGVCIDGGMNGNSYSNCYIPLTPTGYAFWPPTPTTKIFGSYFHYLWPCISVKMANNDPRQSIPILQSSTYQSTHVPRPCSLTIFALLSAVRLIIIITTCKSLDYEHYSKSANNTISNWNGDYHGRQWKSRMWRWVSG